MNTERDFLFGLMAVQLGLATPEQVVSAFRSGSMTMAEALGSAGVLSAEDIQHVADLVDRPPDAKDTPTRTVDTVVGELTGKPGEDPYHTTDEHPGRYTFTGTEGTQQPDPTLRELGRGGIGRVLVAHDKHLKRDVAVKELLPGALDQEPGSSGPKSFPLIVRFLREARVTGQLEHPNIVPVYELGRRPDGTFYYTMRMVRGKTLAASLRACEDLPDRMKLLRHFVDLCHAVAYAHSRGVTHRDIKPENVMVGEFGETVVLDWGIAKVRGKEDVRGKDIQREVQLLKKGAVVKTLHGAAIGTPQYMSPEQAQGNVDDIDEQSDVWSLGVVLYEILTGQAPFDGAAWEMLENVVEGRYQPVSEVCPQAPPELASVAHKAVQREKPKRYQSAKDIADEVSAWQSGTRVRAYRYSLWDLVWRFTARHKAAVIAGVLIGLAALGSWLAARYLQRRAVEREIAALAGEFDQSGHRLESLLEIRKQAFAAFDRDDPREGETRWKEAVFQTTRLQRETNDLWAKLRGLLERRPDSVRGNALLASIYRRLMEVASFAGKRELASHYMKLLEESDPGRTHSDFLREPAELSVLSQPAGSSLVLRRYQPAANGTVREGPAKELGKTPIEKLEVEPGSYLLEARLDGHLPLRYPFLAERGEQTVVPIRLVKPDELPDGMAYVPAGEFTVGRDEPEDIRRYTGSVPRHSSYTDGFVISRREVTFEDYLPFLLQLPLESRESYSPRGPYRFSLGERDNHRLKFRGRWLNWGEKFEYPDCPQCKNQDWRKWPVSVSYRAAEAFARYKSKELASRGYAFELRLPSEREWEKAARGADGRRYPCGEKLPDDHAATLATHGRSFLTLHEVGSHPECPSPFGIDDLAGNAWEWVRLSPHHGIDALALKGGSFQEPPTYAAATARVMGSQVNELHASGFRLAANLPGSEACPLQGGLPQSKLIARQLVRACRDEGDRLHSRADYGRSLNVFARMEELSRQVHGPEHLDTALASQRMGDVNKDQGEYDLALKHYSRVLTVRLKALGRSHPDTAKAHSNIGGVYWKKGDHQTAVEHFEKALAVRLATLGPDHPDTALSYSNIGLGHWKQGKYQRAREFFEKSLDVRLRTLGDRDPTTTQSYNNLGLVHWELGEYQRAREYFEKALAVRVDVLGPNHPDTARTLNNIGMVLEKTGSHDRALEHFEKALSARIAALGPKHPETATSYNSIGVFYRNRGTMERALQYFEKALSLRLEVLGPKHTLTALSYNNLGAVQRSLGKFDQALEVHQKALTIRRAVLGPEHPDTADSHRSIGLTHYDMGQFQKAHQHHTRALEIRSKVLGSDHPKTAESHLYLGHVRFIQERYQAALEHYQHYRATIEKKHGAAHESTVLASLYLAQTHRALSDQKQAESYFKKVLSEGLKTCAAKHAGTCAHVALARCQLGKCDREAVRLAERALNLAPGDPDVHETMAFADLVRGYKQPALEGYCRLRSMGPLSNPAAKKRLELHCPAK